MKGISAFSVPEYLFSSYRYFAPGEFHVSRICDDDVIIMVFDGVLRFVEDGNPVELGKGEFYIQQRGIYQNADQASDSPVYYYVHARCDICDEVSPYVALRGRFDRHKMQELIKRLEESKGNPRMTIDRNAAFLSIISQLSVGVERDNSLASEIAGFIKENADKKIMLDDICQKFGYCKNYVNEIFKRSYSLTVHEYVTECRIDLAKNLLLTSSLSIDEIAYSVGFENYINLYKAFRKKVGISPGEFRKTV